MAHVRSGVVLIIRLALLCIFGASASQAAVKCGDIIKSDLKLTNNLSPCAGDGLVIEGHDLTIDLNGHSIVGVGVGTGIRLTTVAYNITIKGPGQVATFGSGVTMGSGTNNVVIYDISFYGNSVGVAMTQVSKVRVFRNTLDGGSNGLIGAHVGDSTSVYIYQNVIQRNGQVGVDLGTGGAVVVDANTITGNHKGIIHSAEGSPTIRGNQVTNNDTNGIELLFLAGTIEDNTVTNNGLNGIVVGGPGPGVVIQDNVVRNNTGNGIVVSGSTGGVGQQVVGNWLRGNAVDLWWSGTVGGCWFQNAFVTSSPAVLPQCP